MSPRFLATLSLLVVGARLLVAQSTLGAPTPDSLARLVMSRFADGSGEAFDSVFPDPLGREVVRSAIQQRSVRRADLQRVLWQGDTRAVLLLGGSVRPARANDSPRTATTGGDETNRARRFSGLYEAERGAAQWTLARQIPLDTLNFIRAQAVHATITPGTGLDVLDTLTVDIGSPHGFAARFNTAATIASLTLDGRPVDYALGGGVFWFSAKPKRGARLVLQYALAESRGPARDSAVASGQAPAFGAYHNTDAWLPFFNYDSGNSFAQIVVTARIPAVYRLTTSLPQTESVAEGVRTVVGTSGHPEFIVGLMFDRDWNVARSTVATPIGPVVVETFLGPDYRFSHDSLATIVRRVYDVIGQRFGEPQAPTRYIALVSNRALGRGGFSVRMNNAVVGGAVGTRLDDPTLGPSYVLAHETSHGWTMNASSFAANMLQEGWATFAEGTVIGAVFGKEAERAFWERQRTGYMTGLDRAGFLGGFEGRQSILGNPDNGRIHYFKGSWVFRSLNFALGDSVFDRGMREYIALRPKGLAAGYREFIAAMSRAAGRDLTAFIMPWLDGRNIPDVDARIDGSRVIVTQNQPDMLFELPLDLSFSTASGVIVHRAVRLTRRADTVDISGVGPTTGVLVDADHHFLLRRHLGEMVRFELPVTSAPDAKVVELQGNFLSRPMAATRSGAAWVLEIPLTEGRYIWQWRVDGSLPTDDAILTTVAGGVADPAARAGIRIVRPVMRLAESYPR
jgi:hypothetical protein